MSRRHLSQVTKHSNFRGDQPPEAHKQIPLLCGSFWHGWLWLILLPVPWRRLCALAFATATVTACPGHHRCSQQLQSGASPFSEPPRREMPSRGEPNAASWEQSRGFLHRHLISSVSAAAQACRTALQGSQATTDCAHQRRGCPPLPQPGSQWPEQAATEHERLCCYESNLPVGKLSTEQGLAADDCSGLPVTGPVVEKSRPSLRSFGVSFPRCGSNGLNTTGAGLGPWPYAPAVSLRRKPQLLGRRGHLPLPTGPAVGHLGAATDPTDRSKERPGGRG